MASKPDDKKTDIKNLIAEFRRDFVSGEWTLISALRQKRPDFSSKKKEEKTKNNLDLCPFEDPQKSGNPMPILWLPHPSNGDKVNPDDFSNWFVQVIPNKYPVVTDKKDNLQMVDYGPYKKTDAFGFHEVIITRDHNKPIQKMSIDEIVTLFHAYQERYRVLERDLRIDYILIYHNQGELAGASVQHPHSQLVALPIVPPDVSRSINGGLTFYEKNKKCVHCVMLDFEIKDKKRIVYENKHFIVIAPYSSKVPFEMRIFPKKHSSDFEQAPKEELPLLADAMKMTLNGLAGCLKEFDYNFFIHTSSARVDEVPYYHWHIEIYPRTYKWAGLELGTGVEVNAVPPEQAAEEVRTAIKNLGK